MKTFAPSYKIVTGLVLLFSCLILTPMKAQTIQIDSIFTADAEIFPFSPNDTIYGLSISGSVNLYSDTSLVRVILTDIYGQEWMVYEAYPFINPTWNFIIQELADETMYLEIHAPGSLKVEILNATLSLDYITLREENSENLASMQENYKEIIESAKVDLINTVIENNEMLWFANQTPISELPFSEKQDRFGTKYNLMGLDYYTGGIFDPQPGTLSLADESELVDSFDWRKRHGANDPNKPEYYNANGYGWLTEIENQSEVPICDGLCYIYGPIGVLEGLANNRISYGF